MEKRTLGRTGHQSTVVTFGTAGIGRVDQETADTAIRLVLDHGVNHVDIAPSYGEAMERMAPWMPEIRDQVFLGTKTTGRTRSDAWEDIRSIMKRLNVESFDLFQLHSIGTMETLDEVTAPGAAVEALVELRDHGLTRWLGITGHGPEVPPARAAPVRDPDSRREAGALLPEANARNLGSQTIKMIARGGWGDREHDTSTWYDPYREQADIDRALWWVLTQPMHTAPSAGDVNLLPRVLDAAERFKPMSAAEAEAAIAAQRPPLPHPALAIPAAG